MNFPRFDPYILLKSRVGDVKRSFCSGIQFRIVSLICDHRFWAISRSRARTFPAIIIAVEMRKEERGPESHELTSGKENQSSRFARVCLNTE